MIEPLLRIANSLRSHGLMGTVAAFMKHPLASSEKFRAHVIGRRGLEIGGPSQFFRSFLPIYECVESLDNCVFAGTTIWEGEIGEFFEYHPQKGAGRNYVVDGGDLHQFRAASYDFVLSCHNLEHIANPIKALKEWIRVTKPGGCIILVVPDYRRTFDHLRRPTPVEHMLEDYLRNIGEDDRTHLQEILAKHDIRKDPGAGSWENFRERSMNNLQFRALHHHVFSQQNIGELLAAVGLQVEALETALPHHIAALAVVPREYVIK